jgi:SagB-type dehydrogenase family enzyme
MNIFQLVSRKDPNRIAYEEPLHTVWELYHEVSRLNSENFPAFTRHIREMVDKDFFLKLFSRSYKTYPTSESTILPYTFDDTPLSKDLRRTVLKRRSIRKFGGGSVSFNNLANIIFNAYAITAKTILKPGIEQKLRAVPSGGALFPLELYVASFKVDGLRPGIYHYNVEAHSLELVREGQFSEEFGRAVFYEDMFKDVSATFIITGRIRRSFIKYGERSYRFMMLEAGHLGQNICLTSFALELGCLMLGGFYDDDIDGIIGVDGVNEMTLYTATVGTIP